MPVNAGTASSSAGPHAPGVQKPTSSGLATAATGLRAVASSGESWPSSETPWSGLSGEPTRSRMRPSQPVRRCGSSAPTSQKWREVKWDWSAFV